MFIQNGAEKEARNFMKAQSKKFQIFSYSVKTEQLKYLQLLNRNHNNKQDISFLIYLAFSFFN